MVCAATAVAAHAQTFKSLVNFDGTDGASPRYMSLVQGPDGEFYGTTADGGTSNYGTVFKMTASGTLSTIYNFCSQSNCADGQFPDGGLVLGSNGNFYGTTFAGGANDDGTVFRITRAGALTTLHSFDRTDGSGPSAPLVEAVNGSFYGTTQSGGASSVGTVFKITAAGAFTSLHSFDNSDGAYPYAGLVQASNGNLYGTTESGGSEGDGSIFSITMGGTLTTIYNFCSVSGCDDGEYPFGGLIQASDKNLYGTAYDGGTHGDGTIFKITTGGTLTTIYNFCSQTNCIDGSTPEAGLIQATDGNFYGVTAFGGTNGYGTVFKVTSAGALTTLNLFDSTDGSAPVGGLLQGTNGTLYGTTYEGGTSELGTVYSETVGLGPFVKTVQLGGAVGSSVIILGNDLTGSTSVTFNGTAATFKVAASTAITTTVPSGATSGTVEVTTPKGTLKSNVPFLVIP
jgi:uncharacterized repeat protein (TIGR03803 family)